MPEEEDQMYETKRLMHDPIRSTDTSQQATKQDPAADDVLLYESRVPAIPFKSN